MTDTITPPVELPSFELQMIDYLRARLRQESFGIADSGDYMPQWVPSAIRIAEGNLRDGIKPGDWPCTTTVFGRIQIACSYGGHSIRIDFFECTVLAFRWNAKRETVLRERAGGTNLKSEISDLKSESTQ